MIADSVTDVVATRWIERLQSEGYRMTNSRLALIETIADSARVLSADEIHHLAMQQYPELGRATVYRTLDMFVDLGLVRRIHDEQGCHGYMSVPNDGAKGLLVCDNCHRVEDVPAESLEILSKSVLEKTGFRVGLRTLQLSGLCVSCQ